MPRLTLAVLGPPTISVDGRPLQTDRRKAVALLAYLAVSARPHTRAELAALLWPDYPPPSASAYLRRALWELNQALGKGWVEADREQVALAASDDVWLDVAAFRAGLRAAPDDVPALAAAVELYRGEFLAGFSVPDTAPFAEWQAAQAEALRRDCAGLLQRLADALAAAGNLPAALEQARRWLMLDPLHEPAHRAVMRLLAQSGDRAGAIRQYEAATSALLAELRATPEPETTALYETIRRGELTPAAPTITAATPPNGHKPSLTTLPAFATPFIGRRAEVEQLKALVQGRANRLITLVGVGGTGKTRLSIQAAAELRDQFPDGVYFAPLAAVPTPAAVLPALAKAINFSFYREGESHQQQLLDYLSEKQALLVLDNFEHLLGAAPLAGEIMARAPAVTLLVTSRTRLNVAGEQLFQVGGMRLPTAAEVATWTDPAEQAKSFSAVLLFLERARSVRPDFALTPENAAAVLAICRLAQGMPLVLELAAAWVELLSPAEIADQIARSLDFLETDQAGVPDRQRSLRAVFESSWALLSAPERQAFQQLCVLHGRFSREAAQHVTGASLRTLLGLANKSWLLQTDDGRFQLHDLMRQYGAEQLRAGEAEWRAAHDRHAAYFVQFASEQLERMRGPEQPAGVQAMGEEFDTNLRAAWDWLAANRRWAVLAGDLTMALHEYGMISWRVDELIGWLRPVRLDLAGETAPEAHLAKAIITGFEVACELSSQINDASPAERLMGVWQFVAEHHLAEQLGYWFVGLAKLVQSVHGTPGAAEQRAAALERLRRLPDRWLLGKCLMIQSDSLYSQLNEAELLEAAEIFRALGAPYEQGDIADLLGLHATQQGRPLAEVEHYFRESRRFYAMLGGYTPSGLVHSFMVGAYVQNGQIAQAYAVMHDEQRVLEQLGNQRLLGHSLHWQSLYLSRYGGYAEALATRLRSRALMAAHSVLSDAAWQELELAEVHRSFGEVAQARSAVAAALAQFEALHLPLGLGFCARALGDLALRDQQYAAALEHFQRFLARAEQDSHRWGAAQAHGKLALAHAWLGDLPQARQAQHRALLHARALGQRDLLLMTLLAEVVCRWQAGAYAQSAELAALIAAHPVSWNEVKAQARDLQALAAQHLSAAEAAQAEQRGQALELEAVVQAFLQAEATAAEKSA